MPFLIVSRGSEGPQRFELKKGTAVIGRDPECDIVLNSKDVSRHHARITWQNNTFYLEDLKSRNRTFLNRKQVEADKPMQLHPDDEIKICCFYCKYVDETAPKPACSNHIDLEEEGVFLTNNSNSQLST